MLNDDEQKPFFWGSDTHVGNHLHLILVDDDHEAETLMILIWLKNPTLLHFT